MTCEARSLRDKIVFDLLHSPLRKTFRTSGRGRRRGRGGSGSKRRACSPRQGRRQFLQGCPKSLQISLDLLLPSDETFFGLTVSKEAATSAVPRALCAVSTQRWELVPFAISAQYLSNRPQARRRCENIVKGKARSSFCAARGSTHREAAGSHVQ